MKVAITNDGRFKRRNGLAALYVAGVITPPPVDTGPVPEGTVTVNAERQFRWNYQRRGTSKSVPIAGTSTAPAGTIIEARVIDELSGAAVTPWQQVGVVLSDQTYGGLLDAPQGKWYRRQVRKANAPDGFVTETNSFGVGIIVLAYGQSNMDNMRNTGAHSPLGHPDAQECETDGIMRRSGNISKKLADGTDKRPPNSLRDGVGGYDQDYTVSGRFADGQVYVPNLMTMATGLPVTILNRAIGGKSIEQLTSSGSWDLMAAATASIGGDFEVVIFYQGEHNIGDTAYKSKLTTLHEKIKTLVNRDNSTLKFGVISLGPVSNASSWSANSLVKWGEMRAMQVEWANSTPGAFYVTGAHDQTTNPTDGLHITGGGFHVLGRRYAKSILAQLGYGTTAAGPRLVSAVRSGTTVTCTAQHTGGTALQDGAGGAGADLRGFQFRDGAGVLVPITGSAITGANTFTLTLASEPTGACTLSYAMENAPLRSDTANASMEPTPAFILIDNAAYFATLFDPAIGCPMQPCAAIAVA
jgi:hypothetical protein